MPDYSKGKIYALKTYQSDDVYIGSTTQALCQRKGGHKRNFNRYKKGKYCYVTSFKLCEYDDMYIELIENYPCATQEELHKREGEIIREINCVNKVIAGRSKKQWYEENKERLNQKSKENYLANKEKYNAMSRERYQKNKEIQLAKQGEKYTCECGKTLTIGKKSRHEKSRKHIEYLNGINISDQTRKYTCECGSHIRMDNKHHHLKSKKHVAYLESFK